MLHYNIRSLRKNKSISHDILGRCQPSIFFFKILKTIYSEVLKLSPAVRSFSVEIDVAMATIKFHVDLTKTKLLR